MVYEAADILIIVKAYPNISKRYNETVCIAGVRVHRGGPEWIRLFPLPFRDLDFSKRFSKYQWVSLRVDKHQGDGRPESYRPDPDSLQLGEVLTTQRDPTWSRRKPFIEPLVVGSMCEIKERQRIDGTSLGAFRPAEILDFDWEAAPEREPEQAAIAAQPSLFGPGKQQLEHIPFRFRYRYRCDHTGCRTHHQSIIDWELGEAYRSWSGQLGLEGALGAIRNKWLEQIAGRDRDTVLYVGNQYQFPESFLVLGAFWPRRAKDALF